MKQKEDLLRSVKRSALLGVTLAGLISAVTSSLGANMIWNGTMRGTWTTTANLSLSPVRGVVDTAAFNSKKRGLGSSGAFRDAGRWAQGASGQKSV